jgi:REP element-mobilizing transposase RayT
VSNTYTQLFIHLVFAVKNRQALISPDYREEIERYATGLLQHKKHKVLAIYLMPDHAHILSGWNPSLSISETVQVLKVEITNFIQEKQLSPFRFAWQNGYGAFSHSKSEVKNVIQYIRNQPEHHARQSFRQEYLALLQRFEIEFQEEYLFEFFLMRSIFRCRPAGAEIRFC